MFHNAKTLEGHELNARDGVIGHVKDFYFDDRRWTVRYLVVDTGSWLASRNVLIAPRAVHPPDFGRRVLPVDLTKEQVRNSPGIDTAQPVSLEQQRALNEHYAWPNYWGEPGFGLGMVYPIDPVVGAPAAAAGGGPAVTDPRFFARPPTGEPAGDPNLRSVREVTGYHIEATDGSIGHVEDFLIEDETWKVRYLVVDTRNWWPGRKVLVAPDWISAVDWPSSSVAVDLTRDAIKSSPPYDPARPLTADHATALHDYYGRGRSDV